MKQMWLPIFALLATGATCFAHSVHISGTVRDDAGNGIQGVTVRLGKTDIATITRSEGNFTLTGSPVHYPFLVEGDSIVFNAGKPTEVRVEILDSNGKAIVSNGQIVSVMHENLTLPHFAAGTHTYRISVKDMEFTFTIDPEKFARESRSKAEVKIEDALVFTKTGFRLSRLALSNPDGSAIRITLSPLRMGTVTDVDGNTYKTVRFGNQEWTVENLRTTRYNDGTPILNVPDSATWLKIYSTGSRTPAYGIYGSDSPKKAKYGLFYNWYAVNTGKLAPKGWRVPTDEDWDTLRNYLIANGYNYDGTTTGNRIAKSMATTSNWDASTLDGAIGNHPEKNNASGFSALPGGLRHWGGSYFSLFEEKIVTYMWSSTEYDSIRAWHRYLNCNNGFFDRLFHNKNTGFPVRIMRDAN